MLARSHCSLAGSTSAESVALGLSCLSSAHSRADRSIRATYGICSRLARRASIDKRVPARGLRHAFSVEHDREGAIVSVIRDLPGHSSAATTDRYLRRLGAGEAVHFARRRVWPCRKDRSVERVLLLSARDWTACERTSAERPLTRHEQCAILGGESRPGALRPPSSDVYRRSAMLIRIRGGRGSLRDGNCSAGGRQLLGPTCPDDYRPRVRLSTGRTDDPIGGSL
jgi:hypothetical protein